jgi:alpha-tubulin suppressor-like RCC1 family protein
VTAGAFHTCGIATEGDVYCWGDNEFGQLGYSAPLTRGPGVGVCAWNCSAVPLRVASAPKLVSISAGFANTCGLTAAGEAYCWGGSSQILESSQPKLISGELRFESLVTGDQTFGIATDGRVYELNANNPPTPVASDLRFRALSAGSYHLCGIATDEFAYCWGTNYYGQLGNGSRTSSKTPVRISGQP